MSAGSAVNALGCCGHDCRSALLIADCVFELPIRCRRVLVDKHVLSIDLSLAFTSANKLADRSRESHIVSKRWTLRTGKVDTEEHCKSSMPREAK